MFTCGWRWCGRNVFCFLERFKSERKVGRQGLSSVISMRIEVLALAKSAALGHYAILVRVMDFAIFREFVERDLLSMSAFVEIK